MQVCFISKASLACQTLYLTSLGLVRETTVMLGGRENFALGGKAQGSASSVCITGLTEQLQVFIADQKKKGNQYPPELKKLSSICSL